MDSSTSDVIIVGGGVIGLSCAWALAKEGIRVTVLERDECSSAASGASLGVLWPPSPLRKGPFYDLHRESLALFPKFIEAIESISGLKTGYAVGKCLKYIANQAQVDRAHREVKEETEGRSQIQGITQEIISDHAAKRLEPEIESQGHGVLLSHKAGNVAIAPFMDGLIAASKDAGVKIIEHSPVAGLVLEEDRVTAVKTGSQVFESKIVLTCAGAWNSMLSPVLEEIVPVEPVRGHGLLLKMAQPVVANSNIVRRKRIYLIPGPDGELTVGATTEQDSGFNDQVVMGAVNTLISGALRLAPGLKPAVVVKMWAGLRPSSIKGKPYIGPIPGIKGLYTASGHYKTGIAMAPITGKIVADLIVRGETGLAISDVLPIA